MTDIGRMVPALTLRRARAAGAGRCRRGAGGCPRVLAAASRSRRRRRDRRTPRAARTRVAGRGWWRRTAVLGPDVRHRRNARTLQGGGRRVSSGLAVRHGAGLLRSLGEWADRRVASSVSACSQMLLRGWEGCPMARDHVVGSPRIPWRGTSTGRRGRVLFAGAALVLSVAGVLEFGFEVRVPWLAVIFWLVAVVAIMVGSSALGGTSMDRS